MAADQEYEELRQRLDAILIDLDRLQLPLVAVHVDLARHRLEEHLAQGLQNSLGSNGAK